VARKTKAPADERFDNQDFDLFKALEAMDRKDYGWFDRLSEEQQRKFVPKIMTDWMSAIKGDKDSQAFYLLNTEAQANKHLFNEAVMKHPKLQWLMLCAASPGLGKKFHQWIPKIGLNVSKLKEKAVAKDVAAYYTKIYPSADAETITELAKVFVEEHKKKMYLSKAFPDMKLADIETLFELVTDQDIENYEKERGNL
jgi:hypothetical protein